MVGPDILNGKAVNVHHIALNMKILTGQQSPAGYKRLQWTASGTLQYVHLVNPGDDLVAFPVSQGGYPFSQFPEL